MSFINTIKERAKKNKKTIVLPETMDKRVLEATEKILNEGIANIIKKMKNILIRLKFFLKKRN